MLLLRCKKIKKIGVSCQLQFRSVYGVADLVPGFSQTANVCSVHTFVSVRLNSVVVYLYSMFVVIIFSSFTFFWLEYLELLVFWTIKKKLNAFFLFVCWKWTFLHALSLSINLRSNQFFSSLYSSFLILAFHKFFFYSEFNWM